MEQSQQVFYKYRSLQNFKNFVDIILNRRLYAAAFEDLNDPMEGIYLYSGTMDKAAENEIYSQKKKLRICSLGADHDDILMWSHYADGHKGVAIGIKVLEGYEAIPVIYSEGIKLFDDIKGADAKKILSCKINAWRYEQEVRIFTERKYVPVQIDTVYLGHKMAQEEKEFIKKLISTLDPSVYVQRQKEPLNSGAYMKKYDQLYSGTD